MFKLLVLAGLLFACPFADSSAISAKELVKLDASRVGACQAVFAATHDMVNQSMAAMKLNHVAISPADLEEMDDINENMAKNIVNFEALFEGRLVYKAATAQVSEDEMKATKKVAFIQQAGRLMFLLGPSISIDQRADVSWGLMLTPAVRMCVRWFNEEKHSPTV